MILIQLLKKIIPVVLFFICIAPGFAGIDQDFKKAEEELKSKTEALKSKTGQKEDRESLLKERKSALLIIKKMADDGYQPALSLLAEEAYNTGQYQEALIYYGKLAEKGDKHAKFRISYISFVRGSEGRVKELPVLQKMADEGYQPAMSLLAEDADRDGDWEKALRYYRKLAEGGDSQAEFRIGVFHAFGYGVPQNNEQALSWITRAAEKGNQLAINTWVRAYLKQGLGLTIDPASVDQGKALAWLKRSAETEYAPALEALAEAYRSGKYGLTVDAEQAKALAAKLDAIKADYDKADRAWLGADFSLSTQILFKLANKDYAPAFALLGYISEKSVFLEESAKFYRRSAEQGFADGEYYLGGAYSSGNGVRNDPEQALFWMTRAAEQGHALAITALSTAYSEKKGYGLNDKTVKDEQVVYWLKKAVAINNVSAIEKLLDAYRNSKFGLQPDSEQIAALEEKLKVLNPKSSTKKKRVVPKL